LSKISTFLQVMPEERKNNREEWCTASRCVYIQNEPQVSIQPGAKMQQLYLFYMSVFKPF